MARPPITTADVGMNKFINPEALWYAVTTRLAGTSTNPAKGAMIGIATVANPDVEGIKNEREKQQVHHDGKRGLTNTFQGDLGPMEDGVGDLAVVHDHGDSPSDPDDEGHAKKFAHGSRTSRSGRPRPSDRSGRSRRRTAGKKPSSPGTTTTASAAQSRGPPRDDAVDHHQEGQPEHDQDHLFECRSSPWVRLPRPPLGTAARSPPSCRRPSNAGSFLTRAAYRITKKIPMARPTMRMTSRPTRSVADRYAGESGCDAGCEQVDGGTQNPDPHPSRRIAAPVRES